MIIRAININKKYQYSKYKIGWVFEVVNDFGEYYTARVLSGSKDMHESVIAVKKTDCEQVHLGSYNGGPTHMEI
jgi:hypothetical protein|tara:strand:- start:378 stop:599 length:222 start_codon:yes stop_codon:yes gene_type:complete